MEKIETNLLLNVIITSAIFISVWFVVLLYMQLFISAPFEPK